MFKALKYDVTFPSTGRQFSADLTFEKGMTAIVGSNESGKTLILEMLRYALFGNSALRGPSEDYKTLSVECTFVIRGDEYTVTRRKGKAELTGPVKASGTTPVNEAIVHLLGFGLPVFDVACSVNQGEVDRLGALRPAQRKQLVDSVLGIDILDVIAKWGADEARLLEREAEGIPLICPTKPEGDHPHPDSFDLENLRAKHQVKRELQIIVQAPLSKPVRPEVTITASDAALEELIRRKDEYDALLRRIQSLPTSAPEVTATLEQWDQYETYEHARKWLEANPRPIVDADELLEAHDVADLMDRLAAARAKGGLTCQDCGSLVPHEHDTIQRLETELAGRTAARPSLSRAELARIKAYDYSFADACAAVQPVEKPSMTRAEIRQTEVIQAQVNERRLLETSLGEPVEGDPRAQLADLRHQKRLMAEYEKQLQTYGEWAQKVEQAHQALEQLGDLPDLMETEKAWYDAVIFHRDMQTYLSGLETYNTNLARAEELREKAAEFKKVKETMAVLRTLIKQHLLPSLNRVASKLLSDMTGGQRVQVLVDEEFDIFVDGQRLETLSGSGQACANLAIRIGLGQVLTNRVFSSLLADEIDASMDAFRAQETSNMLSSLQSHIDQILLVSHKNIEAPRVLEISAKF